MDPAYITDVNSIIGMFQPKGQIDLDKWAVQSVIGPIGQPAREAIEALISSAVIEALLGFPPESAGGEALPLLITLKEPG